MPIRTTHLSRRMNWPWTMNRAMVKPVQPTNTVVRVACASMLMAVSDSHIFICVIFFLLNSFHLALPLALHSFKSGQRSQISIEIMSSESESESEYSNYKSNYIAITAFEPSIMVRVDKRDKKQRHSFTFHAIGRIVSIALDYHRHYTYLFIFFIP